MEKVTILLSTYNGENFIIEQLESLLNQTHKNIQILIRDDGSKDKTSELLRNFIQDKQNMQVFFEKNVGVIKSFFELVEKAQESDYYFFCDQDDFWEKEKVEKAIQKIKEKEKFQKYIGYCSNLKLVDEKLLFLGLNYKKKLIPSLKNCFFENIVTGCTYACNKNLFFKIREEIKKIDLSKIIMHDYFFCFINCLYGDLIYDENSYILYRQHSGNVIGSKKNFFSKNIGRLKKINSRKNERYRMFAMLLKLYNEDIPKNINTEFINNYNNFFKRLKYIFTSDIKRQNKLDTFLIKILYLLKYY